MHDAAPKTLSVMYKHDSILSMFTMIPTDLFVCVFDSDSWSISQG